MTIKKFNNLSAAEVFFQLNFIDGFKYIDKAGEIMNWYVHKGDKIPKFQMDPSGLIISKPTNDIESLKVTPTSLWMHFKSVPNLGFIEQKITEEANKILEIVEVDKVQRLGLRCYLIHDGVDIDKNLSIESPETKFKIHSFVTVGELDDYSLRLEINPVKKNDSSKSGILFDADLFVNDVEAGQIPSTLVNIRTTLQSDKFIDLVNKYLKK